MIRGLAAGALVVLAVIAAGFVAERIFGSGDDIAEATEAIEGMPYRVSVREASEGVLVGRIQGDNEVVVRFAASEEGPEPVDIPPRLVHAEKEVTGGGGFWVWDDAEFWATHGTGAQWNEAAKISVGIDEALCRKFTGDPCPV